MGEGDNGKGIMGEVDRKGRGYTENSHLSQFKSRYLIVREPH